MTNRAIQTAAAAALVAAACGGGSGGDGLPPAARRDAPPASRDPQSGGRDNPGATRDAPGSDRQPGGATSGTNACVTCDASYRCTSPEKTNFVEKLTLETQNGVCVIQGGDAAIRCDGTIVSLSDPTLQTTWAPSGDGGFSFVSGGTTVDCVPDSSASPTPVAGAGAAK